MPIAPKNTDNGYKHDAAPGLVHSMLQTSMKTVEALGDLTKTPSIVRTPAGRRTDIETKLLSAGPTEPLYNLVAPDRKSGRLSAAIVTLLAAQPEKFHVGTIHLGLLRDKRSIGILEPIVPTDAGTQGNKSIKLSLVSTGAPSHGVISAADYYQAPQVTRVARNLLTENGSIAGTTFRFPDETMDRYLERLGLIPTATVIQRPSWDNRPNVGSYTPRKTLIDQTFYDRFVAGIRAPPFLTNVLLAKLMRAMDQALVSAVVMGKAGATAVLQYSFCTTKMLNLENVWLNWLLGHITVLQSQFKTVRLLIDDEPHESVGFYLVATDYIVLPEGVSGPYDNWMNAITAEPVVAQADPELVAGRILVPSMEFSEVSRKYLRSVLHEIDQYRIKRFAVTAGRPIGDLPLDFEWDSGVVIVQRSPRTMLDPGCNCSYCQAMWDCKGPLTASNITTPFKIVCRELKDFLTTAVLTNAASRKNRQKILEFGVGLGSILPMALQYQDIDFVLVDNNKFVVDQLRAKPEVISARNISVEHYDLNCSYQRQKFFAVHTINWVFAFWSYQFMTPELLDTLNTMKIPVTALAFKFDQDMVMTHLNWRDELEMTVHTDDKTARVWVKSLYHDTFTEPLVKQTDTTLRTVSEVLPFLPAVGPWAYVAIRPGIVFEHKHAEDFMSGYQLLIKPRSPVIQVADVSLNVTPILAEYTNCFAVVKPGMLDFAAKRFYVGKDQVLKVLQTVSTTKIDGIYGILKKYLPLSDQYPTFAHHFPLMFKLWSQFVVKGILTELDVLFGKVPVKIPRPPTSVGPGGGTLVRVRPIRTST